MVNQLFASPFALIAFILMVAAAIGLVIVRQPSVAVNRGLWFALLAGIGTLVYIALKPAPPAPPGELLTGDISVPAYSSAGTPFQNYMGFAATFRFAATGQWSTSERPDSITDAGGRTGDIADERYTLPGAPIGGLLMQRLATGVYEFIGRDKTLELAAKEQVLFQMNDFKTSNAYSDNTGLLKLGWTCFNCIP
jgi:hypothetical protein